MSLQHSLAVLLGCIVGATAMPTQAAFFEPINELFRFGEEEHLIIDRGGPVDLAGDVNGDGEVDLIVGSGAGAVRIVFGPTLGDEGFLNAQRLTGVSGFAIIHDSDNLSVVSGLGDFNGDGFDDVVVGSLSGTHVIFGHAPPFSASIDQSELNGHNGFHFSSAASSVSNAGDVNGDGLPDLLVGDANASANNLAGVGISYVIYGSRSTFPEEIKPSDLDGQNGFAVVGISAQDRSGQFVGTAGDFNNDGIDDFMIGAPNKTQGTKAEVGEAYVVYGSRSGYPAAISLYDINGGNGLVFKGSDIQDSAGAAVTEIGDINHDGIGDIAIGAPGKGPFGSPSDYPGEVYVLFGGQSSGVASLNEDALNGSNGFVVRGIRGGVIPIESEQAIWGDLAGTSIDTAGDINNDGIDDLLIGASHTIINPARKGVGQAYFVFGSTSAFPSRVNLNDLDGGNGFRINGIGTVDYFAVYLRQAGDFNVDGIDDVVVGASGQGHTYVIYGRDAGLERVALVSDVERNGSVSTGYLEVALNVEESVEPLGFNELRDPTGPDPLPVGTPTELGDPETPGNIPANVSESVEPPRPSGSGTDAGSTDAGSTDAGSTDAGSTDAGSTDAGSTDGGSTDAGTSTAGIKVGTSGGATLLLPLMLLGVFVSRLRWVQIRRS